jgi:uncharacterized protein (DUF1800 family)
MPLTPYTGAWGPAQIKHLLRRTTFGLKKTDIDFFSSMSMTQMVNQLLAVPSSLPSPPVNDYSNNAADPNVAAGQTWVNAPHNDTLHYWRDLSINAWWIEQLINENRSIVQKMTLFLHLHCPINYGSVFDAHWNYDYHKLLLQHCLGNFKTFVKQLTINEGMLVYLDGQWNNKWSPNQNYARELQELFTIGKDAPPYYTQQDVVEAAKVLTGWRINYNWTGITTVPEYTKFFDISWHDTTNKTFSSFYNNTVITGGTSATAGNDELDQLLTMIFNKNEVSKFFVRKLYRYFVYYKIDTSVETNIIEPLATTFRNNNYNILPVLQELFTSQHFYEAQIMGANIKNPLEFVIGVVRAFNVNFPTTLNSKNQNFRTLYDVAGTMLMKLGEPPNVAGWSPYYQSPYFHEMWITPDTMRRRKEFVSHIINSNSGYNNGGMLVDTLAFTETMTSPGDPDALIDEVLPLFHTIDDDAYVKEQLRNILLSGQTAAYYWTIAWNNYVNNKSNMTYRDVVKGRLKPFYEAILNMAEYNLC